MEGIMEEEDGRAVIAVEEEVIAVVEEVIAVEEVVIAVEVVRDRTWAGNRKGLMTPRHVFYG